MDKKRLSLFVQETFVHFELLDMMRDRLLLSIAICVVVGIAQASIEMSDEYYTQPIRAKFDDNTIITTTHAEARQMGKFN